MEQAWIPTPANTIILRQYVPFQFHDEFSFKKLIVSLVSLFAYFKKIFIKTLCNLNAYKNSLDLYFNDYKIAHE